MKRRVLPSLGRWQYIINLTITSQVKITRWWVRITPAVLPATQISITFTNNIENGNIVICSYKYPHRAEFRTETEDLKSRWRKTLRIYFSASPKRWLKVTVAMNGRQWTELHSSSLYCLLNVLLRPNGRIMV